MPTRNFKGHGKESYYSTLFILNNRHPRAWRGDNANKTKFDWAVINAHIRVELPFFPLYHCSGWWYLLLYRPGLVTAQSASGLHMLRLYSNLQNQSASVCTVLENSVCIHCQYTGANSMEM